MKIRTQLLLACFVLSIVPLTGIVFYSYQSSRRAVERAYQREATRLTAQMDRRLGAVQTDLDESLAALSVLLPDGLNQTVATKEQAPQLSTNETTEAVQLALADVAPLVERLQIVPALPPSPVPERAAVAETRPLESPSTPPTASPAEAVAPAVAEAVTPPAAPAPPAVPGSIVVEVPRVAPDFGLPPDFSERIREISMLSKELSAASLTPEERAAKTEELKKLEKAMSESVRASRERRAEIQQAAREQRRMERELRDAALELEKQQRRSGKSSSTTTTPPLIAAGTPAPATESESTGHPAAARVSRPPSTIRVMQVQVASKEQLEALKAEQKQVELLFGRNRFNAPLRREGQVVGHINAEVSSREIVKRVLGAAADDSSEIPFAVDREGTVYARNDAERATLTNLGIVETFRRKEPLHRIPNWVVAMSFHRESGLRIGVARPVGESFEELRKTAARNFGWGMGVIVFALLGIVPIADHFTRDVKVVTEGAKRVAHGDLQTRVPVRTTNNEFGQLAMAFNRMAEDLSLNQQQLVEQERARQEQEIQQRLLALEYGRKSVELEEARRFQLSMLPKQVPQHPRYDVAVLTQTAAEVGGDYYDFHVSPQGVLSVTIGDATGHGAKAGTMVTVIKTLFAAYDGTARPAQFLGNAAETIKRMELGRMAMALSLARLEDSRLTIATAGMPPMLVHRAADGRVDEVSLGATPLGTLGVEYGETVVDLNAGDTVLLMSDGLPELLNAAGQQLGYVQTTQEFAAAASAESAEGVLARLAEVAKSWHGEQPPNDDITFVAVRVRA